MLSLTDWDLKLGAMAPRTTRIDNLAIVGTNAADGSRGGTRPPEISAVRSWSVMAKILVVLPMPVLALLPIVLTRKCSRNARRRRML